MVSPPPTTTSKSTFQLGKGKRWWQKGTLFSCSSSGDGAGLAGPTQSSGPGRDVLDAVPWNPPSPATICSSVFKHYFNCSFAYLSYY